MSMLKVKIGTSSLGIILNIYKDGLRELEAHLIFIDLAVYEIISISYQPVCLLSLRNDCALGI